MSYVLGGFEDGSIVLWDERNNKTELNFCQLFSDPGKPMCNEGINDIRNSLS